MLFSRNCQEENKGRCFGRESEKCGEDEVPSNTHFLLSIELIDQYLCQDQAWRAPSKIFEDLSKIFGDPSKISEDQSKISEDPSKISEDPSKISEDPRKTPKMQPTKVRY